MAGSDYLLDGASVFAEVDASNNLSARYLLHPQVIDEMLEIEQGGQKYSPLTDALGSVYALSDSSGAVVRNYSYEVYGKRQDLGGSGPTVAWGFTGREHDSNGLNYHRDRSMDPARAHWTQADRLGLRAGPNLYEFVRARPTLGLDPRGLSYEERMQLLAYYAVYLDQETEAGRRIDASGWFVDLMASVSIAPNAVGLREERVHACGEQSTDLIVALAGNVTLKDYKPFRVAVEGWDPGPPMSHQWVYLYSAVDHEQLILDPFLGTAWSAPYDGITAFDESEDPKWAERPLLPQPGDVYWQRIYAR